MIQSIPLHVCTVMVVLENNFGPRKRALTMHRFLDMKNPLISTRVKISHLKRFTICRTHAFKLYTS